MTKPKRKSRKAREPRRKRVLVVKLTGSDIAPQLAVVVNLSERGALCRAVQPPEKGDKVTLLLDSFGPANAIVRWRDGIYFGVEFVRRIDMIGIMLARTGFRTIDYDIALTPEFEGALMSEMFRSGEFG